MHSWPLFDLKLTGPNLTLRMPSDDELDQLVKRAVGNILPPEQKHYMGAWTQRPSPEFERSALQHHWQARAHWKPENWFLPLGVFTVDDLVGTISIRGQNFPVRKSITTGSWLLPEARGQGLGKEARAIILSFIFKQLEADEARSTAHPDNQPSHGVSYKLGYRFDGTEIVDTGDDTAREINRLVLKRNHWEDKFPVSVEGFDACRELFGVDLEEKPSD